MAPLYRYQGAKDQNSGRVTLAGKSVTMAKPQTPSTFCISGRSSMREIGYFVGGKEVKGTSGRSGDVFNPNTGEVQAKVAYAKHSEVEHAIAVAEAAQPAKFQQ